MPIEGRGLKYKWEKGIIKHKVSGGLWHKNSRAQEKELTLIKKGDTSFIGTRRKKREYSNKCTRYL